MNIKYVKMIYKTTQNGEKKCVFLGTHGHEYIATYYDYCVGFHGEFNMRTDKNLDCKRGKRWKIV